MGPREHSGSGFKRSRKRTSTQKALEVGFHGFGIGFGGHIGSAEDNKTLACVCPKALSAVFTEGKFQEPLGRPTYTISGGLGGPSWQTVA